MKIRHLFLCFFARYFKRSKININFIEWNRAILCRFRRARFSADSDSVKNTSSAAKSPHTIHVASTKKESDHEAMIPFYSKRF